MDVRASSGAPALNRRGHFQLAGYWRVALHVGDQGIAFTGTVSVVIKVAEVDRIRQEDWATSTHRLLTRAHRAARFAPENDRDVPVLTGEPASRKAWDRILERAIASHEEMPPLQTGKRRRKKRRIGHNLALQLRRYKEGCLRFLTDPRTPFSNNEAERDLRMGKLRQKISGGFRSMQGAWDFANLRSVIATARKQGWNVLDTLAHPDPIQLIPQLRF